MQNLFNTIDQSGWTGVIIFGLFLLSILLFIELHEKKQEKLFLGNRWVKNDYNPIFFRIVFVFFIFFGGIALFFIIKSLVL